MSDAPSSPRGPALPAETVLAVIPVSPGRRWMGLAMTGGLGLALVWLGFQVPLDRSRVGPVLVLAGILAWAMTLWLHRASAAGLVLTARELREEGGRVLAPVAGIRRVERGVFAAKPSQGFLLRLEQAPGAAWRPGVWWRLGRSVGIGGVLAGRQAKDAAGTIELLLAERRGELPAALAGERRGRD